MTAATTLQTFLFTDLVGSMELKRAVGDAQGSAAIAAHDEIFRACLAEFDGVEQTNPGDGFFATFAVPSAAVRCALAFQRRLRDLDLSRPLAVRIGIHVGETSRVPGATGRPDKLLGLAVDIASRVMSVGAPNQLLMTRPVFDSARQHVVAGQEGDDIAWRAHGPYLLKGIDDPVAIFEAGIAGIAPLRAPADSDMARRAVRPGDEETLGWRPAAGLEVPLRAGWKLERQLGEGGFGEIWLVRNERTREQRAFKFCFHAERLRSLKRELTLFRLIKQTLGDRPDITRLYEVQFDEPPYFLEMEYTSGGSLDHWLTPEVPRATRIDLVAQVADALAAAHSVGVIHKDVKPSNVLIDTTRKERPQARLTDFGIGRLVDPGVLGDAGVTEEGFGPEPTMATDLGSRTGTRIYMAPELLRGRPATIASDLYSVGVLLYQMVVGEVDRPLAQGWEADVDDELLREDIAACVAGAPEARLPSADLLATRLRTLPERRKEREQAREQVRREARRRRVFRTSLAASVVLLLVAATAVVGYLRADRERRRAESAEARAEQRFSEVRGLANAVLFEFDDKLANLPGSLPARRVLVERALRYLDNLPGGETGDEIEFALERARGYQKVASIQGIPGRPNLGDADGATANLGKALAILERMRERDRGGREVELAIARILTDRAGMHTHFDLDDSRNPDLDRAEEIVDALVARDPTDLEAAALQAKAAGARAAWLFYAEGGSDACHSRFEKSIALYRALLEKGQLPPLGRLDLATVHSNFGIALSALGQPNIDFARAGEQYEHERALLEDLQRDQPGVVHIELALVRNHLGLAKVCYFQRELDDALGWYAKAEERIARLRALYPSDLRTRRFLGFTCRGRAQVHNRNGETRAALEQYEQAIEALTDLPPGTVPTLEVLRERGVLHEQAARAHLALDDADGARAEFERSLEDFKSIFSTDTPDLFRLVFYPRACLRIAGYLGEIGDEEGALELLRRMDAVFDEVERAQPESRDVAELSADSRTAFAHRRREAGKAADPGSDTRKRAFEEAITIYRKVLATYAAFPDLGTAEDRDALEASIRACED